MEIREFFLSTFVRTKEIRWQRFRLSFTTVTGEDHIQKAQTYWKMLIIGFGEDNVGLYDFTEKIGDSYFPIETKKWFPEKV